MSYIALARKWRPRTFAELVGQPHTTKALSNSLNQQRIHHAYLFTGTRGIGKTSIARLLAKALNCEAGVSESPCLTCSACLAIEQGAFLDLIEIDGASRTKVEDTRDILENVQYAPTQGRFKIYLIDEVHMLSNHSFNALLKTLEEPPDHVKFILATTEPQKLPVTVLSRCLQFHLKPLSEQLITNQIEKVLTSEAFSYDSDAVTLLATAARGSMRDALSLLDQAIAVSGDKILGEAVRSMLGLTQKDYALPLIDALTRRNPTTLMSLSQQIAEEGGNFQSILESMLRYLHQIAILQQLPTNTTLAPESEQLITLSQLLSPEDVQLFYQIGLKAVDDIQLAPSLSIGFEMALMRMYAFKPAPTETRPPLNDTLPPLAEVNQDPEISRLPEAAEEEPTPLPEDLPNAEITVNPAPVLSATAEDWPSMISQLKLTGLALSAAENAEFISKEGKCVNLRVAPSHRSVFTASVITRLENALGQFYQEPIKITLNHEATSGNTPAQERKKTQQANRDSAEHALQNDPFFQQLQEEFSAELVKNSIASGKDDL